MVELNDVVGGVCERLNTDLIRGSTPDLRYCHEGSAPPSAEGTRRVYDIGRDLVAAAAELRRGGLSPRSCQGSELGRALGEYMAEVTVFVVTQALTLDTRLRGERLCQDSRPNFRGTWSDS